MNSNHGVLSFPKRWVSFGTAAIITLILVAFFRSRKPESYGSVPLQNFRVSTPLLGSEVDEGRFYFPPFGDSFQPQPPMYNAPPPNHIRAPLFIAFTRNNDMLQQVVLSYIAAGWPREDIVVVDNSGTMDANSQGLLSRENPFFLDYALLRGRYGVSILQTPTLLSFSQLMNFYLRVAIANRWQYFLWSHMDIVILSDESDQPYKSFYEHVLDRITESGFRSLEFDTTEPARKGDWAVKYFSYDWLTLVNVAAWRQIGQWDPFIPYYDSDCDAYSRIILNGFTKPDARAGRGRIFDVASVVSDPESRFFPPPLERNTLMTSRYQDLVVELERLEKEKPQNDRNRWQFSSTGGSGEPWTYDPKGFQRMWWDTASHGRKLYKNKWDSTECRLDEHGFSLADEWKTEHQVTFGDGIQN